MLIEPQAPQPRRELLAGRYRVDGLLGQGGMSQVYYGYDERLDRAENRCGDGRVA